MPKKVTKYVIDSKWGQLTVIGRRNGKVLVRCDCGTIKEVAGGGLGRGKVTSCGCAHARYSVGTKWNRLTVIEKLPKGKVAVKCECGVEKTVFATDLGSGNTKSCGCLNREKVTKHGGHGSRLYMAWANMKARCRRDPHYKHVSYAKAWETFPGFKKWAEANGYEEGLELDRKANSYGYYPANCRWVNRTVQCINTDKVAGQSSKYRGVSTAKGKWKAQLVVAGNRVLNKTFETEVGAAKAYNYEASKHLGEFANLNVLPS